MCFAKDLVGIWMDFNLPVQSSAFKKVFEEGFQSAGIGYGLVQEPKHLTGGKFGKGFCRQFHGGKGFADLSPGAMESGKVTDAAVLTDEKHPAAEGCLEGNQDVVAIEDQRAVGEGGEGDFFLFSDCALGLGACGAHQGQPLAAVEGEMVSDQF
jgi:hypothetical protein